METKKLITPRGALLLLALLLAAAGLYLWLHAAPPGVTAVVECDGTSLWTQDLTALTAPLEKTFPAENGHIVTIQFTPEGARFTASTCPDHTCVRTGLLTRAGETALCLPARVTLRLTGPAAFDAATY